MTEKRKVWTLRNPFRKEAETFEVLGGSAGNRFGKFDEADPEITSRMAVSRMKSKNERVPQSLLSDTNRRVPRYQLEDMFATEPVLQAGIMMWQNLLHEADFIVKSKNPETQAEIDRILKTTNFREVWLQYVPTHLGIYGDAFIEPLWNTGRSKILFFNPLNPCEMDFKRNKTDNSVIFDSLGLEAGFVQTLSDGSEVTFTREELFHITMFQVNRGQWGIGFVEPIYQDSEIKENLERARSQMAYASANRVPMIGYGSERFKPNDRMKERAESLAMQLVNPDVEWVTYSKEEFEISFSKEPVIDNNVTDQLIYISRLQAAILRIPLSILLQSRLDEGSGDIDDLIDFMEYEFKSFQKRLKVKESLVKIIELENQERKDSEKIPIDDITVEYGLLTHKSAKEMIMKVMRMGKANLLDVKDPDVTRWLKDQLGIQSVENAVGKKQQEADGK